MDVPGSRGAAVQRAVERREDVRFDGGLDGSFSLSGGRADRGVSVFACRVDSLSATAMVVTAPVSTHEGEAALVDLAGFGIIRTQVLRLIDGGFVAEIMLSNEQRMRLSAWIHWLRRHAGRVEGDKRGFMRTRPRDPRTTVLLEDGRMLPALIINLSRSGAAVSADISPAPGSTIWVGQVEARVVRALDVGFAVAFERVLAAVEADSMVSGFEPAPETSAIAV